MLNCMVLCLEDCASRTFRIGCFYNKQDGYAVYDTVKCECE